MSNRKQEVCAQLRNLIVSDYKKIIVILHKNIIFNKSKIYQKYLKTY